MRELAPEINWTKKYSESSEDYILRMLFPYKTGKYVEVGVNDPIKLNASYMMYEIGWNGILIEPINYWQRMCQGARPRDIFLNYAASNVDDEKLPFYLHQNHSPASSLASDWLRPEDVIGQIKVPTKRLETLLKPYPEIAQNCDFCIIDVEGWERQVIEGINFETFLPTVMMLESVRWNPFYRTHQQWEPILLNAGYKLICHNLQNRFYGLISNTDLWKQVEKWNLGE